MFKTWSSMGLLATLIFSNAQTPTFQPWPMLGASEPSPTELPDVYVPAAWTHLYGTSAPLHEVDDLQHLEIDQQLIPTLNVDLPELFGWSTHDRMYLAANLDSTQASFDTESFRAVPRFAGFASFAFADGSGGMSKRRISSATGGDDRVEAQPEPTEPNAPSEEQTASTPSDEPSLDEPATPPVGLDETPPTQVADNETPADESTPHDIDTPPEQEVTPPVDTIIAGLEPDYGEQRPHKPVQVPLPGTFGLFVLGLAGLRFAGRNKKRST